MSIRLYADYVCSIILHTYIHVCTMYYGSLKVNTVDCYDPEKNEWTFRVTPMSTRRSSLGVGVAPTFLF